MIYRRFRLFLCRAFSMHDRHKAVENFQNGWDLYRCEWCGLDCCIHWHTKEVRFVSWR